MIESAAESQGEDSSSDDDDDDDETVDDPPKIAPRDKDDSLRCPLADCLFETRSQSSLQVWPK